MKKIIISFFLLLILSTVSFADGDTPTGGKYCNGGTCLVGSDSTQTKEENTVLKYVKDFLRLLF